MRKSCLLLILLLMFSTVSFAGEPSSWSKYSILNLEFENILPDDFVVTNATSNISRRDLAEVLVKFYGVSSKSSYEAFSTLNPYIDSEDEMIGRAYTTGIFEGYEGANIYPDKYVTVEEFCHYLKRTTQSLKKSTSASTLKGYSDYDDVNKKYIDGVDFAFGISLINNSSNNKIMPKEYVTWEMALYATEKLGIHYGFLNRGFLDQDKEISKFDNAVGFLYPRGEYSQITVYPIEDGNLELYMYSTPFIKEETLDIKSQQIELARVLDSKAEISFTAAFEAYKYAIKNWEEVQRGYLENQTYINVLTGVKSDAPVSNRYLKITSNGKLVIEYINR